ncbi:glycosyltransferase [Candidatus Methanocrinis natronophilus]|uniref:Glycosyltransferase n=1 Tax=Candidatus Methanocrinis natronophilus TaxID=3033396 RepID=A0ABT5X9Q4_9EURY|nr:glycosyltransferase [Candidatus Methanocrinis natronophilus]MDF0591407.1 glycosyltransferase [Candidatus Methanocrinis natronophilus]
MKIMLLANQPEKTTRLQMFRGTLEELGYDVVVPTFNSINWEKIARKAEKAVEGERPEVVHVFNVPDVIYRNLPKLRGSHFDKLIYDYRSPWGVEMQMTFGPLGKIVGEHFERNLASSADAITTVNYPLGEKVRSYIGAEEADIHVIPNYPKRSFIKKSENVDSSDEAMVFVGRISHQEGVKNLMNIVQNFPDEEIWIVGDGPFARWHLRRKHKHAKLLGWQPHDEVARLIRRAKLCLIPMNETILTPYATDKSVWKLNEYLNLGKLVVASGVTKEEERKNLVVVKSSQLEETIRANLQRRPEALNKEDFRIWEMNQETIREVYEKVT